MNEIHHWIDGRIVASTSGRTGVVYNPLRDAWTLSRDTGVNYMAVAAKSVA